MVSSVYWEWQFLLLSIRMGIRLVLIYDGIRIFRMIVLHHHFFVSLEDLLFWSYATIVIFEMQLQQSDGVLRGFSILGMLAGMLLYHKLLGEFLLRLSEKGILFLKRWLTGIKKLFKMKLCKQRERKAYNRSEHEKTQNPGEKEKTK